MHGRDAEWDDDWEDDDDVDLYDDDEPTIPCPWCRREIHEDAEQCPYCEHYLSDEDAPSPGKPWWIIVGTIGCLYLCYRWIFG